MGLARFLEQYRIHIPERAEAAMAPSGEPFCEPIPPEMGLPVASIDDELAGGWDRTVDQGGRVLLGLRRRREREQNHVAAALWIHQQMGVEESRHFVIRRPVG